MGLIIALVLATVAKVTHAVIWAVVEYRAERRRKSAERDDHDDSAERVWRFVA